MHPDAERWNARYRNELEYYLEREPYKLVTSHLDLVPQSGTVLDVACGVSPLGELLARRGLHVVALDVSLDAVGAARRRLLRKKLTLDGAVMDLMDAWLPPDHFAAIFDFYFLSRPLLERFRTSLKPGGVVFFETLLWDERLGSDKQHYLRPGELEGRFADWQIHYINEMWKRGRKNSTEPKKVIQLIAQKPEGE